MRILPFAFLMFLTISCETAEYNPEGQPAGVCSVKNPVQDLPWLRKEIEDFRRLMANDSGCGMNVWQVTYQGQTAFYIIVGGPACCGCGGTLYNCAGEVIENCVTLDDTHTDRKILGEYNRW